MGIYVIKQPLSILRSDQNPKLLIKKSCVQSSYYYCYYYYSYLPRIASSVVNALLSMRVLQTRSQLYLKLPFELQNSLCSTGQPQISLELTVRDDFTTESLRQDSNPQLSDCCLNHSAMDPQKLQ